MKSIIYDPVPFCFGPVGKAISINSEFKQWAKSSLIGSGTSEQLGSKEFDYYYPFDQKFFDNQKAKNLLSSSDLIINVMNWGNVKVESQYRLAMVDSLFWMWDKIIPEAANCDFYFIQRFKPIERQISRLKVKNPYPVGPIISEASGPKNGKTVVHLGGVESPMITFRKNNNYPIIIFKILANILKDEEVVFCGNEKVVSYLSSINNNENFAFKLLSHENFLKLTSGAKKIISTPGLTASFEIMNQKKPLFFLPPENYSQFLNLREFEKNGISSAKLNWYNYYDTKKIRQNIPQKKAVDEILKILRKFEKDKTVQKMIAEEIQSDISMQENKIISQQSYFFKKLGGNGTKSIVRTIKRKL